MSDHVRTEIPSSTRSWEHREPISGIKIFLKFFEKFEVSPLPIGHLRHWEGAL